MGRRETWTVQHSEAGDDAGRKGIDGGRLGVTGVVTLIGTVALRGVPIDARCRRGCTVTSGDLLIIGVGSDDVDLVLRLALPLRAEPSLSTSSSCSAISRKRSSKLRSASLSSHCRSCSLRNSSSTFLRCPPIPWNRGSHSPLRLSSSPMECHARFRLPYVFLISWLISSVLTSTTPSSSLTLWTTSFSFSLPLDSKSSNCCTLCRSSSNSCLSMGCSAVLWWKQARWPHSQVAPGSDLFKEKLTQAQRWPLISGTIIM